MINLKPCTTSGIKHYKDICTLKRAKLEISGVIKNVNDVLIAIEPSIIACYDSYALNKYSLEKVKKTSLGLFEIESLKHCYDVSTKALDNLKAEIISNQDCNLGRTCQLCGIDTARTFDHYIPISEMPEFSVLNINLIPICYDCNNLKNNVWSYTQRQIINLYFDELTKFEYLKCDITIVNNVPIARYKIQFPSGLGIPPHQQQIIKYHFNTLNLIKRYNEIYNRTLSTTVQEILNDKINFISNLEIKVAAFKNSKGINNWETSLFQEMLTNIDFHNWINNN